MAAVPPSSPSRRHFIGIAAAAARKLSMLSVSVSALSLFGARDAAAGFEHERHHLWHLYGQRQGVSHGHGPGFGTGSAATSGGNYRGSANRGKTGASGSGSGSGSGSAGSGSGSASGAGSAGSGSKGASGSGSGSGSGNGSSSASGSGASGSGAGGAGSAGSSGSGSSNGSNSTGDGKGSTAASGSDGYEQVAARIDLGLFVHVRRSALLRAGYTHPDSGWRGAGREPADRHAGHDDQRSEAGQVDWPPDLEAESIGDLAPPCVAGSRLRICHRRTDTAPRCLYFAVARAVCRRRARPGEAPGQRQVDPLRRSGVDRRGARILPCRARYPRNHLCRWSARGG